MPAFAAPSTITAPKICELTSVIMSVFNMVVAVFPLGGLAILMYGAFLWATAGAEPQKVQQSQQTLTYGVIGLIVGLSAIAIIGTLQMIILGSGTFKWISDEGVMRVDFCIEDYKYTGSSYSDSDGDDNSFTPGERTCEDDNLVTCGNVCCTPNETCVQDGVLNYCEPAFTPSPTPEACDPACVEGEYCKEATHECIADPCYNWVCPSMGYDAGETECYVLPTGNRACRVPN